jgi:ferredoxin-NADP reductase
MTSGPPRIAVRVVDVSQVTPLVKCLRLSAIDGRPLPPFSGGAHVIVDIPDGEGGRRNAYSLMSSPRDVSAYAISVRRDDSGRGGSKWLHDRVRVGDVLQISAPANLFALDYRARRHLMIAGGIGITPLLGMADQLTHDQQRFDLHYAVRSLQSGAYVEELRRRFGSRVSIYAGDQGQRLPLQLLLSRQPLGTHLYVCGPASLIAESLAVARQIGWPDASLHAERFLAPAPGQAFAVELATSGRTVTVGTQQSMLDAIESAGVAAPYGCRGGACGQCATRVVSCDGRLIHKDHHLLAAEKAGNTVVLPCVSRFEGRRLVLDL